MKKILFCSLGIFLLIFISINAQAYTVIYDQPPFSSAGALISSPGVYYPYPINETSPGARVYDDFTLNSTYSITGIKWWGFYNPSPSVADAFTVRIYSDRPPGTSYTSITYGPSLTVGNFTINGFGIKEYSITLETPFEATAGTKYWLSIYNETLNWGWQIANPLYAPDGSGSIQDPQLGDQSNVAFQLIEGPPVPIPSAAWLLASGLIALVVIRRRIRTS